MENRLVAIPAFLFLAGCGGGGGEEPVSSARPVRIDSVIFETAADANKRHPVRVGLAQIENAHLVEQLLAIPAGGWFGKQGEEFRASHPDAYYDDWELVPGLVAGPFDVRVDEYVSAVLFCHTDAAEPPLRIVEDGVLAVHVEPEGCEVYQIE